jgi:hypothetical protein
LNAETITHTIQFILAPVVMVSSCAILVGGMLTRYAELNDRLRALAHERLDLLHGPGGNFEHASGKKDAFTAERLAEIDAQVPGLLRRHGLVHRGVLAVYLAILIFVLSMLAIAVAVIPNSQLLATMALLVFLCGTGALLTGVAFISVEVRVSNDAVRYEVLRIMGLGK